jgi:glyoxylase-like metal-dependent hydrolase (beta-lactamase superfamily II)
VNNENYRFKLGHFECMCIMDGSVNYPPGHLFANVPKAEVEAALRGQNLPIDYITTPYTHLYVNTGAHQVLVDMGAGNLAPSTGRLLHNMRAAGIEPADIDTVIITHAHPAHVGGALDGQGSRVYVNARYFIWEEEWDFWTSEIALAKASERHVVLARKNLEPIQDRLSFLENGCDIVPGVRAIPAPGHTPGHTAVSVSSGGERLLYISDTAFHPLHLEHPDWLPIYDIVPEKAKVSKRAIFDLAAAEQAWVIGQHFPPFPSLGHVVKKGKGWQWQPIQMTKGGIFEHSHV